VAGIIKGSLCIGMDPNIVASRRKFGLLFFILYAAYMMAKAKVKERYVKASTPLANIYMICVLYLCAVALTLSAIMFMVFFSLVLQVDVMLILAGFMMPKFFRYHIVIAIFALALTVALFYYKVGANDERAFLMQESTFILLMYVAVYFREITFGL
jgi:hypothetical protein